MSKSLELFDKLMTNKEELVKDFIEKKHLNNPKLLLSFKEKRIKLRKKLEAMTEKQRAQALFGIAYLIKKNNEKLGERGE